MAEKQSIEELFRSSIGDAELTPSPRTWKKVQRRLRLQRFLRFDPTRINVYYMGALLIGTTLVLGLGERNIREEITGVESPSLLETPEVITPAETPELVSSEEQVRTREGRASQGMLEGEESTAGEENHVTAELQAGETDPIHEGNEAVENELSGLQSGDSREKEALVPVAGFIASATEGCAPLEVNFSNSSLNASEFRWSFGNGEQSSEENPTFLFSEAGSYMVKLEVSSPGGQKSASHHLITAWPAPRASFEIEEKLEGTRLIGLDVLNYTSGGDHWKWWFSDAERSGTGNWHSEAFQPSVDAAHIPMGAESLTLVAIGQMGCSDTFSTKLPAVLLDDGEKIKFPTAFSGSVSGPNGGHYNPNEHRTDVFHPHFVMEPARYHLRIFSRTGEVVYESVDIYRGWDGYIMEERAAGGVYLWMAGGTWENGATFALKGDLTLLWGDRWP